MNYENPKPQCSHWEPICSHTIEGHRYTNDICTHKLQQKTKIETSQALASSNLPALGQLMTKAQNESEKTRDMENLPTLRQSDDKGVERNENRGYFVFGQKFHD